jgi:hypothetical protein
MIPYQGLGFLPISKMGSYKTNYKCCFFLLMGVQLVPFEDLMRAYRGRDLMESFLKSSWYNSCFEIETAMVLERQRSQKNFKVTERQRFWYGS